MTHEPFDTLCHRASLALNLADPHALGRGHTVTLDGVHIELHHREPSAHFLLLAEIALFPEAQRAAVHEHLLTLQLMTTDHPNLRFGFHAKRKTTLLCLSATPPQKGMAPEDWLAQLVRDTVQQVLVWRQALRESGRTGLNHNTHPDFLQHATQRA
ncbi:hypothetical protein [Hydrogenophaga sp. T2]|uniref:hypothetical protein n=1 Tax=Hydrogenophaga sp. T2 TaxID=3132823 RepID=UPI003CEAD235